jgi:hypothetical protein
VPVVATSNLTTGMPEISATGQNALEETTMAKEDKLEGSRIGR